MRSLNNKHQKKVSEEPAAAVPPPASRWSRFVAWIKGGHANLLVLVGLPGALGGFLTMLLGNNLSPAPGYNTWFSQLLVSLILGAVAGFVVVVVLTNTDRKDYARLFTLAFIAGLAYRPILEKGLASIGLSVDESGGVLTAQGDSFDIIQIILKRASTLDEKTPPAELTEALDDIGQSSIDLQVQLLRLENESRDNYLSFLVTELQRQLTVEMETPVFDVLREADLPIDPLIDVDQPDFFESTALAAIPDRLIDMPVDIELIDSPLTPYEEEGYSFGGTGKSEHWVAIDIDFYVEYVINVYSDADDADLVAALFRASDMELVSSSDDAGDSLNPEIIQSLDIGRYYLQVTTYDGANVTPATVVVFERDSVNPGVLETSLDPDESGVSIAEGETRTFTPADGELPYMIAFEIPEGGLTTDGQPPVYALEVTGSFGDLDLVAGIYDPVSRRLIAYDDDSAGNYNPRLSVQVAPGIYWLRVTSYDGRSVTEFRVTHLPSAALTQEQSPARR